MTDEPGKTEDKESGQNPKYQPGGPNPAGIPYSLVPPSMLSSLMRSYQDNPEFWRAVSNSVEVSTQVASAMKLFGGAEQAERAMKQLSQADKVSSLLRTLPNVPARTDLAPLTNKLDKEREAAGTAIEAELAKPPEAIDVSGSAKVADALGVLNTTAGQILVQVTEMNARATDPEAIDKAEKRYQDERNHRLIERWVWIITLVLALVALWLQSQQPKSGPDSRSQQTMSSPAQDGSAPPSTGASTPTPGPSTRSGEDKPQVRATSKLHVEPTKRTTHPSTSAKTKATSNHR